jgi:hypothetical protein
MQQWMPFWPVWKRKKSVCPRGNLGPYCTEQTANLGLFYPQNFQEIAVVQVAALQVEANILAETRTSNRMP